MNVSSNLITVRITSTSPSPGSRARSHLQPSAHRSAVSFSSNYDPLPYPSLKQCSQSSHRFPLSLTAAYNMVKRVITV